MPISDNQHVLNLKPNAKVQEHIPSQFSTPNPWITGGNLGSKDAVLVFRTCVLSSQNMESESDASGPSASSSLSNISSNTKDDSSSLALNVGIHQSKVLAPLPKNLNIQKQHNVTRKQSPIRGSFDRLLHENKSKKRQLESSSSSSSLSNTSICSADAGDMADTELTTLAEEEADLLPVKKPITATEKYDNKENVIELMEKSDMPGAMFNITYKFINTETRLLRKILSGHGLTEQTIDNNDFSLLWTGIHLKPDILRNLLPYQRVNHFPRSYELTRKDRLYKNIERMQHFRGLKNFDIVPQTYLLPTDYKELVGAHNKNRGPWIVKPVASSRGRGIFIVNSPDQISSDEQVVVAKYISDPLCIDGHKCDIRIYAAVTSFDPLIIYIYEEGLVRLATVKYERNVENLWNPCMHLCNYSINKYHTDYIKSMDAGDEDVGHKWTLSALLRHLRNQGCNTEQLMLNIEDLIIKSILACAQPIVAACRMFVPNQNNCFELFGFDILIDDTLKPWLLEVNLSPSLGCDTPLDTKVKACLLTDLLTLVGIPAITPLTRASYEARGTGRPKLRSLSCYRRGNSADLAAPTTAKKEPRLTSLAPDEARIVRSARIQYERHGGFVRIFPTRDSMQKYGNFLDPVTGIPTSATTTPGTGHYLMIIPHNYNQMLHSQLYPAAGETALTTSYVETENTGVLYRIQKYERALESSLPIVIAPTRTSTMPKSRDEARRLRQQVKKSIENNNELSVLQARKAFTLYLECILRRLTVEPKYQHEDLILKFLYRVGVHMKQPFFIRNFNPKIGAKERGAMVAKQMGDFLYLYTKETESYVDSFDHVGMVPIKLFDDFLSHAQETDVESVLTLHTNLSKQMSFLYTQSTISTPPTPPIPVGVHGFLKALPSMAPGGARDLSRIDAYKSSSENVKKHTKLDKKNVDGGGRSGISVTTTGKLSPIKKKFPNYTKP